MTRLKEKYELAMRSDDVKAIVLTGEAGKFSSGFDLNLVQKSHKTGDVSWVPYLCIDIFINTIEEAKKPSVAAIQGFAFAGAFELALVCHARIATPEVQLGFPELKLGLTSGTQRLPRIVGISKAVDMILTSKQIMSKEGKELGLIDAVVSSVELLEVSRLWALDIVAMRKPWLISAQRRDKLGCLSKALELTKIARERVSKTTPNMPQYQACIDAIEEGIVYGGNAGLVKEAKVLGESVLSSTSRALFHVSFAQRMTSKVPNVTNIGLKPRCIQKVAIIGGGLMGSSITTSLILSNIPVLLMGKDSKSLQRGMNMIKANLQGLAKKGKLTQDQMNKAFSLLKGVLDYSEFKYVDMVVEAVAENILLKQSIFSEIEKICPPHCILATNTSTIDLNVIGEKTSSQDRIIGAHFFSPAHMMPLLEIVRSEKTSPQVILDLMTIGTTMKKVPIVVGNCTGFVVNRTFFPYTQGAHVLLNLGVDLYKIDSAIKSFGMPMGPFQLQDLAGYGVFLAAGKEFLSAFPDRSFQSPLIELMLKNGRNGKNNGMGYYVYEKGSKPKPDPTLEAIFEESRLLTNIMPGGKPISVSDEEIVEMIFFPVVNEACRVMDEGVVFRPSDLDIASTLGMSFPSYRGGIVFWADSIGSSYICTRLKKWAEAYGSFFKPSQFLEERAMKGMPLSAPTSNSEGSKPRL